jgi:hypothetical protein
MSLHKVHSCERTRPQLVHYVTYYRPYRGILYSQNVMQFHGALRGQFHSHTENKHVTPISGSTVVQVSGTALLLGGALCAVCCVLCSCVLN